MTSLEDLFKVTKPSQTDCAYELNDARSRLCQETAISASLTLFAIRVCTSQATQTRFFLTRHLLADVVHKSAKHAPNGHATSSHRAPAPTLEDEEDVEAGPSLPPDEDDDDYGPDMPPDDEEGRFFGGGITSEGNEILDYMEHQESANTAPEKLDKAWLRKIALNFEKRISKNAELRAKFENNPQKFMGSEADLDTDIKALSILSENSSLYPEFARLGCAGSLVGLLAHENTDIAIDAVEIINELTDDDVAAETEDWNILVNAMIDADLIGLLVSTLNRLDEGLDSDRAGIYHSLSVIENLASKEELAEKIGEHHNVMRWLLRRAANVEKPVGQNKQYAAEVLAILLQSSMKNRSVLCHLGKIESSDGTVDAIELLLEILAAYRKRDPARGTEEEEFVENVFDCITCIVDSFEGKRKFLDAEGVELCCIMASQGKLSKNRALRLLDHALGGQSGIEVCEKLVEAAGLKTVFGIFMKSKKQDAMTTEHLLGIFASLLRLLPAESPARIRTLIKFVEKDYEKVHRLVELRRAYATRVSAVDDAIHQEQSTLNTEEKQEMADEWLSRRLDAGLYCLQTIDVILAWLVAEDDGAGKRISELLRVRDESLGTIRATIQGNSYWTQSSIRN